MPLPLCSPTPGNSHSAFFLLRSAEVKRLRELIKAESDKQDVAAIPDDAETNSAASKLQGAKRMRDAKARVEKLKAEQAAAEKELADAADVAAIPDDAETNSAAAKLQGAKRMKDAKARVEKLKAEQAAAAEELANADAAEAAAPAAAAE